MDRRLSQEMVAKQLDVYWEKPSIEIEVGTGKGLFLAAAAKLKPDTQFLGLELASKYAIMAQDRMNRIGLSNVQVFGCDAVDIICRIAPTCRIDAVHVYFPDPWWKKKHKKRRVLSSDMLVNIQRVLKLQGELHFWTDVLDYYEDTLQLIAETTQLHGPLYVAERLASHDLDYLTHFERRTRLNGLPVYRSRFVKKSESDG